MSQLVVQAFLTLDGVMQAPGPDDDDRDGGFEHVGWMAPYFDEDLTRTVMRLHAQAGALLLGRRTYETMAGYWPRVTDTENPLATTMNRLAKHVASRTLTEATWRNSALLAHDVPAAVAELKKQPGSEIQVIGSGRLVRTLRQHDLVDVYRLWIFPVLLGAGKRLFAPGPAAANLELVDTVVSRTGVAMHTYRRR
ncbi:dihydrofolate reductase family protein [Amycolatopsis sp. NPDC059021]|uniref:dihydrofolate reductase family protein n=1 Tax=Amycolatopsis sp. NPDC059021 TaxID=3346704 RepID=UPI00366D7762